MTQRIKKEIKRLEDSRADLADALLGGQATDWAHYKQIVGKGQGIDQGIEALKGILKNDEDDEDDDT